MKKKQREKERQRQRDRERKREQRWKNKIHLHNAVLLKKIFILRTTILRISQEFPQEIKLSYSNDKKRWPKTASSGSTKDYCDYVILIRTGIVIKGANILKKLSEEVGGTLTGDQPAHMIGLSPKCRLVKGLVGLRSGSGVVLSHGDGGLGWLRGWLVSGLGRGWF